MQVLWNPTREILKKHTLEVNPIPYGGSCRNVPPYQEIVYLDFCHNSSIYCSAWLKLKLITKSTLHTCCSDPQPPTPSSQTLLLRPNI